MLEVRQHNTEALVENACEIFHHSGGYSAEVGRYCICFHEVFQKRNWAGAKIVLDV